MRRTRFFFSFQVFYKFLFFFKFFFFNSEKISNSRVFFFYRFLKFFFFRTFYVFRSFKSLFSVTKERRKFLNDKNFKVKFIGFANNFNKVSRKENFFLFKRFVKFFKQKALLGVFHKKIGFFSFPDTSKFLTSYGFETFFFNSFFGKFFYNKF